MKYLNIKMPLKQKKNKKPKKISFLLNKVIEDYKKKQKNNEKKEIKLREEIVKKEIHKNLQKLETRNLKKKKTR